MLDEICNAIGITNHDAERLREALVHHARFYAMSRDRYEGTRAADVRRELDCLAKLLHQLAEQFELISEMTRDLLLINGGKLAEVQGEEWFDSVYDFPEDRQLREKVPIRSRGLQQFGKDIKAVYRLETVVNFVLRAPPADKGGRIRNRKRFQFISDLASTYEEFTHRHAGHKLTYERATRKYYSSFFLFVEICLGVVEPDHGLDNNALGNLIRSVLANRHLRQDRSHSAP